MKLSIITVAISSVKAIYKKQCTSSTCQVFPPYVISSVKAIYKKPMHKKILVKFPSCILFFFPLFLLLLSVRLKIK